MKGRRIFITIILLLVMLFSAIANYLNSGVNYLIKNAFVFGVLNFIISAVCMICVPLCCRIRNKEKLETKKGRKICKWNSIVLLIISIILAVAGIGGIIGGIGALIFYFINKWAFVRDPD